MGEAASVALIDGGRAGLSGVSGLLDEVVDIDIVGTFFDLTGLSAVRLSADSAGIAIVDFEAGPPVIGGPRALRGYGRWAVLVTGRDLYRGDARRLVRAGARGVVDRDHLGRKLVPLVRAVAAGATVVSLGDRDDPRVEWVRRLTRRESEVLAAVAEGASNQEIAASLTVSVDTIRFHVSALLRKSGCDSRQRLIATAHQHGIV